MTNRILWVLGAVAALIVVLWLGSQCTGDGDYKEKMAAWQARAEAAERANQDLRAESDLIKQQVAQHQREDSATVRGLDSLQRRVASERSAKNAALAALRARAEAVADTGALLRQTARDAIAVAEAAGVLADSLDAGLTRARTVIDRQIHDIAVLTRMVGKLETQNDSLLVLVRTVPVHGGDKLLGFLPLPSRTASFAIGAVLGAGAAVWMAR